MPTLYMYMIACYLCTGNPPHMPPGMYGHPPPGMQMAGGHMHGPGASSHIALVLTTPLGLYCCLSSVCVAGMLVL